jgi:sterol desaturase/sphingolipid hydroxylase (fatty acid hydroxylase superfamily)
LSHQINFLWTNMLFTSSEEFNLVCALRQPVPVSSIYLPFYWFQQQSCLKVIAITLPIHLFFNFGTIPNTNWFSRKHTGFSLHHSTSCYQPWIYGQNHSQIFIIWDKLFGTFQAELESVPPCFGIHETRTWNPIRINFQHLWLLITDAWRAENWKDNLLFGLNQRVGVQKILKKNIL